ncbi:MAG: thioredoxin family protein, partial [Clostridia bacterium]|nr:thioredoxin family protein [Clostridia bacterium]
VADTETTIDDGRERVERSDKIRIFATKTCPKCKHVAEILANKGTPFEKIYAEDNMDLCRKYNIRAVPVMILPDGLVMRNFQEIMDYAK